MNEVDYWKGPSSTKRAATNELGRDWSSFRLDTHTDIRRSFQWHNSIFESRSVYTTHTWHSVIQLCLCCFHRVHLAGRSPLCYQKRTGRQVRQSQRCRGREKYSQGGEEIGGGRIGCFEGLRLISTICYIPDHVLFGALQDQAFVRQLHSVWHSWVWV